MIEAFEELEKAKPPKTPRQTKTKPEEQTSETKPTKPTGRKPPMNRESIVPTPRRTRRSTKSSDDNVSVSKDDSVVEDDVKKDVEQTNGEQQKSNNKAQTKESLNDDDQIKTENQKQTINVQSKDDLKMTTPEKSTTNSQDKKTTIEKVVSLTDKLLSTTPEKSTSANPDDLHHQTNGQNGKMTIDESDMQIDKFDACLNGESVKRKSSETDIDSLNEPSKKHLKTSDDSLVVKESNSNGLAQSNSNNTTSLVN